MAEVAPTNPPADAKRGIIDFRSQRKLLISKIEANEAYIRELEKLLLDHHIPLPGAVDT